MPRRDACLNSLIKEILKSNTDKKSNLEVSLRTHTWRRADQKISYYERKIYNMHSSKVLNVKNLVPGRDARPAGRHARPSFCLIKSKTNSRI